MEFLTPVERLFRKRDDDIKNTRDNITEKKAELNSSDDAVERANRQNLSNRMCGKCHLRTGHMRRNCTLDSCNSARSCGDLDKHCEEKAKRRKLVSEIASLETHLKTTIDAQQSSKKTYQKMEESFAARIEQDIIDTNPNLYIQNGVKNWSLIRKHVAVLEKLCQGKLPRRSEIPELLKTGLNNAILHQVRLQMNKSRKILCLLLSCRIL